MHIPCCYHTLKITSAMLSSVRAVISNRYLHAPYDFPVLVNLRCKLGVTFARSVSLFQPRCVH